MGGMGTPGGRDYEGFWRGDEKSLWDGEWLGGFGLAVIPSFLWK